LEQIVGGPEPMKRWLKHYFSTFSKKSLTSEQMKENFLQYFSSVEKVEGSKLSSIDWNKWWYSTGMPDFDPNTVVNRDLVEKCEQLVKVWKDMKGQGSLDSDLASFQAKQIMYFLDLLILNAMPMDHQVFIYLLNADFYF
jgi:leukotriene-A4 hydrolase